MVVGGRYFGDSCGHVVYMVRNVRSINTFIMSNGFVNINIFTGLTPKLVNLLICFD